MSSITGTQSTQIAQLGSEIRGGTSNLFREAMIRGALVTHEPQRAAESIQRDMTGEGRKYTPEQARETLTEISQGNPNRRETAAAGQVLNILFPDR